MVRVKQTFPLEVENVNVVSVDDDPIVNSQKNCSFPCDQPASSIVSKKQANAASYVGAKRLDKKRCSFNCENPVYSSSTIYNERQAEFVFDSLGAPFIRSWTKRYFCCQFHYPQFHEANEEWNSMFAVKKRRLEPELPEECSLVVSKKAPQVAVKRKDSSSTPTSQPCCDVCGWNEGIFETIESLSYARHIDRVLGCRISENWQGSARICLCHILECGTEKNHYLLKLHHTLRVRCALCSAFFISTPNDTVPPGSHSAYCPLCVKKMRQRKCSICGEMKDLFQCVQVNDIMMKAKLNDFFRTNMELDEQTEHMCSHHWNQWFDQHIQLENVSKPKACCVCGIPTDLSNGVRISDIGTLRKMNALFGTKCQISVEYEYAICYPHWTEYCKKEEKNTVLTVESSSTERHDFGITNKQEIREETGKEFEGSVKKEHQSMDMNETTNNQLVKDEVINVEQLIGQARKIPQQDDHKSDVPPIDSDDLQQCTVAGDVLIDSDYPSNSGIPLKEEMSSPF